MILDEMLALSLSMDIMGKYDSCDSGITLILVKPAGRYELLIQNRTMSFPFSFRTLHKLHGRCCGGSNMHIGFVHLLDDEG